MWQTVKENFLRRLSENKESVKKMKVLLGTTNPSKRKYFEELLDGFDMKFYTLKDLKIAGEPEETGRNPEENAVIKARYYGRFFDTVICNDSGLYFDKLPPDDERQPGLHIRTPRGSRRLDDEEMIAYYGKLIHSLGGRVEASYHNGFAVNCHGKIASCTESSKADAFYMIDTPSPKRQDGWPLDSLSLDRNTLTYFVDEDADGLDAKEEEQKKRRRGLLIRLLREASESLENE